MEQARIVLTTVSSLEEAERIADSLVEQRLAACVNLLPGIKSVYRWQNAIEKAAEILLVIKTSTEKLPALETAVHELHPYDVPEFVIIDIESGSASYLRWLSESLA
jgi:periplasmic divalent cation tolerance protein